MPRDLVHFWAFSKAGKTLGDLHVHYETEKEYTLREEPSNLAMKNREVVKMKFAKTEDGQKDKTRIVYNPQLTLTGVPLEAYEYEVNGKSAIEWVMDRYRHKTHKASQIANNPNDWSDDPNYIVSLLEKVVTVSVESARIIKTLPSLEEEK